MFCQEPAGVEGPGEKAIHVLANLAVGVGGAAWLATTSSPWATGVALSILGGCPGQCLGLHTAGTFALGGGLLARAFKNIKPLVDLARSGAPLPQTASTYLVPGVQVLFGINGVFGASKTEYRICFDQDAFQREIEERREWLQKLFEWN